MKNYFLIRWAVHGQGLSHLNYMASVCRIEHLHKNLEGRKLASFGLGYSTRVKKSVLIGKMLKTHGLSFFRP